MRLQNTILRMDEGKIPSRAAAVDRYRKLLVISSFLNTGLTSEQVRLVHKLIEKGVNPNALAHSIGVIQEEVRKLQ